VLSASLSGIWNASSYLRRQRPIAAILLESRKKRRKLFMHVRGLVATAVVQFSDGVAQTRLTSNALSDMASYEQAVREALRIEAEEVGNDSAWRGCYRFLQRNGRRNRHSLSKSYQPVSSRLRRAASRD
jgi:hypothetical protein